MIKVLVTGSEGQLGKSLQKISKEYSTAVFSFKDSKTLDITDLSAVNREMKIGGFHFCINCAAYTNVEQAEKTPDKAFEVNAEGARNIALACKENDVVLSHISTDYVFDGEKESPYTVDDIPNPINQYGKSKLRGEKDIQKVLKNYFIIRTSWLYSEFGNNFYRTILEKAKFQDVLYITDQELGCPTDANNLAKHILELIASNSKNYGIHHYTDGIAMTWYEFAKKILLENGLEGKVHLEKAKNYRTFAQRPKNSVLDVFNSDSST